MEQKTIVADDEENVILEWEHRFPFLHIPLLKKILMALGIPIFIPATILAIRIRILNGLIIINRSIME